MMILLCIVLAYPLVMVIDLFWFWVAFAGLMNMKTANDANRLAPTAQKGGKVLYVLGGLWDVRANVMYASLIFWELPRLSEPTISQRLARLVKGDPEHWRTKRAIWYVDTLINPMCPPDQPHIQLPA